MKEAGSAQCSEVYKRHCQRPVSLCAAGCVTMVKNRQALTVLCVLLLGLVGVLLYRIQALSSQSSQELRTFSRFSAFFNLVNPGKK